MSNKVRVVVVACISMLFIGGTLATPAVAVQPPVGYPTQQIMATANNPGLGVIPIRRGFWDADAGEGFGMDKAWHYHNLPSLKAQRNVLLSTNRVIQGNGNWQLKAWAQKIECTNNGVDCEVVDEREVWGIYNPADYATYYGWPIGGEFGLQTMYCQQGGDIQCPNWVVLGLNNISNSPLLEARDDPAESNFLIEEGLTTEEREAQRKFYANPEIEELLDRVASGDVRLTYSYKPIDSAAVISGRG